MLHFKWNDFIALNLNYAFYKLHIQYYQSIKAFNEAFQAHELVDVFARVDSQSLAALALVNYAITDEKQKPNTQARLKRNRL